MADLGVIFRTEPVDLEDHLDSLGIYKHSDGGTETEKLILYLDRNETGVGFMYFPDTLGRKITIEQSLGIQPHSDGILTDRSGNQTRRQLEIALSLMTKFGAIIYDWDADEEVVDSWNPKPN